jgi:hypothetical protein
LLDMWMGKATMTLKKAIVCVLSRMLMGVNGRDVGGTYRYSTCSQIEQSWGTQLFKKEGATYVTLN